MPSATDIVPIELLDSYCTEVIRKVNDAVAGARNLGIQASLPEKIDFDIIVLCKVKAFEFKSFDDTVTTDTGTVTDKGENDHTVTEIDHSEKTEHQTGHQTDTESGSTVDSSTGKNTTITHTDNSHVNNGETTIDTYKS